MPNMGLNKNSLERKYTISIYEIGYILCEEGTSYTSTGAQVSEVTSWHAGVDPYVLNVLNSTPCIKLGYCEKII